MNLFLLFTILINIPIDYILYIYYKYCINSINKYN